MLLLQDIENQTAAHPTFSVFNREKLQHFYRFNGTEIKEFQLTMKRLMEENAAVTEEGAAVMTTIDGKPAVVFKSPEARETFQAEYSAFLAKEIFLTL